MSKTNIILRVSSEKKESIREAAKRIGISMTSLLLIAVDEYINKKTDEN